jgi:hypothetical protein
MKTYLVRARGDAYYVAKIKAKSPEDALERAEDDVEDPSGDRDWYREDDPDDLPELTGYEVIQPSDTSIIFPD